jgi:hypothetical protein
MPNRARFHRGRQVLYTPTAAETTAQGGGQWPGLITRVNADGTCDLAVWPPAPTVVGAALADPLVVAAAATAPGGAYNQVDTATIATLANANKAAINAMVTRLNQLITAAGRKASVKQGGQAGQFTFQTGHSAS